MSAEWRETMPWPFRPTSEDLNRIGQEVSAIPDIQAQLLADDPVHLKVRDRVAHRYQVAGGKVLLRIVSKPPNDLNGVGLFEPDSEYFGIGRVSTGLGCPHAETRPDFLGLRLAFQTRDGFRVDFIGINDRASPTDTHIEFMKLLKATAKGASAGFLASAIGPLLSLVGSLGLVVGGKIAAHVLRHNFGPPYRGPLIRRTGPE